MAVAYGPEIVAALAAARRRASRDQDREIDTAHLLHSLLESDPEARAVLGTARVAKLLGYLVQRSIGYGLRWRSSVEDSGASPTVTLPGMSPSAARAMSTAGELARRRGESTVRGLHLLAALAEDPGSRAAEVLRRVAVDPGRLGAREVLACAEALRAEQAGR
ncbi:peptidase [Streptomyces sp. NA04227]|uniref:Clp protease N-terminal domain-containing protein n=1 Tax=Streptomyces sp. NA04227 TaxID=2742136 RepID=UPI00159018D0|nr:Clp protease N-terminal domain-containing protein [Streptomyces sp. NA04227]QKW10597.1 peptidase [Streptomyces sp. NA04227]